jgi:hypothetical protein
MGTNLGPGYTNYLCQGFLDLGQISETLLARGYHF